MLVLLSLMYGNYDGPECEAAHMKLWVEIETGYYAFNIIFCIIYFKNVQRYRRESIKLMLFNCFLNVLHTGWLIYGNVIWYKNNGECSTQFAAYDKAQKSSSGENLIWLMLAQVVIGYYPMLKCCSISTLIICFGPSLWRSLSRGNRADANWVPTSTNILQKMVKNKFNPEEHPENTECIVCLLEY